MIETLSLLNQTVKHNTKSKASLLRERAEHGKRIAEIDAELAEIEAAPTVEPDVYTTAPGGPLPPRRTRRWLRDHAREIPGAVRTGGARGRSVVWSIARPAYEAWLAAQTKVVEVAPEPADDVHDWIAAAGIRLTRRSA